METLNVVAHPAITSKAPPTPEKYPCLCNDCLCGTGDEKEEPWTGERTGRDMQKIIEVKQTEKRQEKTKKDMGFVEGNEGNRK